MKDDDVFDVHFPGAAMRLTRLRAADREFDEICRDYLDVFGELARGRGGETGLSPRYLADLAETLSDLRRDIQRRLRSGDFGAGAGN